MADDVTSLAHVDMDAFFAQVEKNDNPELRETPVIVGGLGSRGVVSTACYRAREFGVHSAMPMSRAKDRCPQATFLSPRSDRYREVSSRIRSIFQNITPTVKPLSLDEAYLDVTGVLHHYDSAEAIAEHIRSRIFRETDLTASVGIGPNKMIAKLASDQSKPDGFRVVEEDEKQSFLARLDIGAIPGFGPSLTDTMKEYGINTIQDLQSLTPEEAVEKFGQRGLVYYRKAHGQASSPLKLNDSTKSISHEETYEQNVTDSSHLKDRLYSLTGKVAKRLRNKGFECRTVVLKERRGDFTTLTRQRSLADYINDTETLWQWVQRIFREDLKLDSRGIRLQGVGVTNLRKNNVQTSLFDDDQQSHRETINETVDEINQNLGENSVIRARDLENP